MHSFLIDLHSDLQFRAESERERKLNFTQHVHEYAKLCLKLIYSSPLFAHSHSIFFLPICANFAIHIMFNSVNRQLNKRAFCVLPHNCFERL